MSKFSGFLCVFLAVLFTVFCCPAYNSVTYQAYNGLSGYTLQTFTDDDGVFLVEIKGKNGVIRQVSPTLREGRVSLPQDIFSYSYNNGCFYFLCYAKEYLASGSPILTVYYFNFYEDNFMIQSVSFSNISVDWAHDFAVTDRGICFLNRKSKSGHTIETYSHEGALLEKLSAPFPFYQLLRLNGSTLLGICSVGGIYSTDNGKLVKISNLSLSAPCNYTGNNTFTDSAGGVYQYQASLVSAGSGNYSSGLYTCTADNYTISFSKSTVYSHEKSTGKTIAKYDTGFTITQMVCRGNTIIAIGQGSTVNIAVIQLKELQVIAPPTQPVTQPPTANNGTSPNGGNNGQNPQNQNSAFSVTSSVYIIQTGTNQITNIPAGTTIAALKRNITHNGDSIGFLNYKGESKTSGAIGTNGIIRFTKGSSVYSYTLIVTGDVTGEGSVNSRDKAKLFQHLLDAEPLSGNYFTAADIDKNGTVNTKDLLLLSRRVG